MSTSYRRCLECGRAVSHTDARRGLCRSCYRKPEVRHGYDTLQRGGGPSWSAEERIRLIALFDAGLSDRDIARLINRPCRGLTKQRQRLGGMRVTYARQALHRRKAV